MKRALQAFCAVAFLAAAMLPATPSLAAPGVQPWNTVCNRFYSQWKKKPKHKAFAVATSDYQQSCGATWGHPSVEAAKREALKWCRKQPNPQGHCVVTKAE